MALGLNLVNHWLLNNNSNDNTGTLDGADSGGVEYKGDNATFDGTSGYIDTGYVPPASSTYTYSLWAKTTDTTDSYMFSDEHGQSLGKYSRGSIGYSSGGSFILQLGDGVSNWFDVSYNISTWLDGDYHHWALVFDAFSIKLYIDGVLRNSYTSTVSAGTLGSTDYWFGRGSASANSFSGDLSNARIYSDAKNQTQIDELFAEGYYPKPLTEPTTTNLITHYPLTGTAEDGTGTYNGTENGNTYVDDDEFGSVASFDGVDDSITLPNNYDDSSGTISLWIKGSGNAFALSNTSGVNTNAFYISLGTHLTLRVKGTAGSSPDNTITTPTSQLNSTTWYFVTVGTNGSSYKVTINDVDQTLTVGGGVDDGSWFDNLASIDGTFLGKIRIGDANYSFTGNIRNFRRYDTELTPQEITDIYNYEKNFRSIAIDDGLIAYYPLANNSLDNYYNEYDGTDTAITYDGESALFNGTTSVISVASAIIPSTNTEMAISFWAYTTTLATDQRVAYLNEGADLNFQAFSFDASSVAFRTNGNITAELISSTVAINTWYHCVYNISDSGGVQLFLDKVLDGTSAISNGVTHDLKLWLGADRLNTFNLDGNLRNFRIFDKTLTPEQVEVIYDSETAEVVEEVASGSGSVLITSSKSLAVDYTPQGSGSAIITSSKALATQYIPYSVDDGVVVTGTGEVEVGISPSEIFTFVQTIQKANIESHFIFVQSIEQPTNSIIIKRVNQ